MSQVRLGGLDAASGHIEWFEQPEPVTEAIPVVAAVEGGELTFPSGLTTEQRIKFLAEWSGAAEPTRLASEAEHQAALAEIDLPPHPLRLRPSRWAGARRWSAETLQVALGATLGCGGVLAILSALAWLAR